MEFKHYTNGNEFVKENERLLLEKEWLNNLMVGNFYDAINSEIDENWILARVTNNDKTELIIMLRRPWKLLLYSPTNNKTDELYKFAAEEIYKIDDNIPGVNTENDIARKFADSYCKISNKSYKVCFNMRILVLENLLSPSLRNDVIYRRANKNDKDILKNYIKEFHKEALNEDLDDEKIEENFNRNLTTGYFVLEKSGKIVAQATSSRKLTKGKSVSGVFTPKEERKKGFAYNLIYRISKEFLDNGAEYCVLFTDDTNPISNHVYEKIGYKRKVDTIEIEFI